MFDKIAVPIDGSHCADQALNLAIELARTRGGELAICCVVDPIVVVGSAPPSPAIEVLLQDRKSEAQRLVAAACERAQRSGVKASGEMRVGVPYEEIVRFAADAAAHAIVIGTHGRSGVKRLLMGSVAESVLREATVPVIAVREAHRPAVTA